jgi:hypothetical protein
MSPLTHLAAAVAALLALAPAHAGTTCYDFDNQVAGASWAVDASVAVPISIGQFRVRPLKLDGVVVAPASSFFKVADAGQKIAGGAAPEMYGKNVALQIEPAPGAKAIWMKVSHQPGPNQQRTAFVEVNGERHNWRGSFERLDGKTIGPAAHPARIDAEFAPVNDSLWHSGRVRVRSQDGIRSFTLGAAELRLDDVCVER